MDTNCDLIKTIEDDQEVPNFSEDSDVEDDVRHNLTNYIRLNSTTLLNQKDDCLLYDSYFGKIKISELMQFQPRKQKKKENKDFDNNFQFVNDISDYNKDTWNDLNKYIKRKAKTKLDDKIKRIKRGSEFKIQVHIYTYITLMLFLFIYLVVSITYTTITLYLYILSSE